ncbi:hypothetical protein FRB96_006604 [Tulasnella sp. 330]|nr:hypothetical protein FRB96_006604 [Tulasnella sp. 330]KAG8884649.1 hypothetical protein FRB97_003705 [Tulasnella sp. 331]KAG8889736.1 hypothetical protein FRB98_003028 [Tulasnella sp. 332]
MLGLRRVPTTPIIDQDNPLYVSYMSGPAHPFAQPHPVNTFMLQLTQAVLDEVRVQRSSSAARRRRRSAIGRPARPSRVHNLLLEDHTLSIVPWRPSFAPDISKKRKRDSLGDQSAYNATRTLTQDGQGDLLCGPVKHVRSNGSYDSASFVLSDRADCLSIPAHAFESSQSGVDGYIQDIQPDEQHSYDSQLTLDPNDDVHAGVARAEGLASVAAFVERLDGMFSGTRLKERISHLSPETDQDLVDIISHFGLLNLASLTLLQNADIKTMSLTESMKGVNGLNEGGRDALQAFTLPYSFIALTNLILSDVPLRNSQIRDVIFLPNLGVLRLDNTSIENPSIFILVAMRSKLYELRIRNNNKISDDCVSAFAHIGRLQSLDIRGTSISIHGLRRLAKDFVDEIGSRLNVDTPDICTEYMNSRDTQYATNLEPVFPIVTTASQCPGLTIPSLKKNLKIHAVANPAIKITGNQVELCDRLMDVLRIREADAKVLRLLNWYDDSVDAIGESFDEELE